MAKNKNKNNQPKSNVDEQAKKNLYAKLGINEEHLEQETQIMLEEEKQFDKNEKNSNVIEEDKRIGWKNPKELLLNFLYGIFMAISDTIPGYSGGTTLSIIGFYNKLISNAKNIFKPEVKGTWWKYLLWIIPFVIAWVGFLILIMFVVNKVSDANKGIVLVFLFGSFSLFSIPFFFLVNKNKLPSFVTKFSDFKRREEKWPNRINLGLIILGFLILFVVAIVVRFALGGISFINDPNQTVRFIPNNSQEFDMGQVFIVLFSGMLAGFCMLIPGISGSLMLYLCNIYNKVSGTISDVLSGNVNGMPYLILLVAGMVLGIIVSVIIVNWMVKKWEKSFYALSLGFVLASFLTVFVSVSGNDYATLSDKTTLGLAISMIPIALIVNTAIFFALNQFKLINFPKLYIKTKKDRIVN